MLVRGFICATQGGFRLANLLPGAGQTQFAQF